MKPRTLLHDTERQVPRNSRAVSTSYVRTCAASLSVAAKEEHSPPKVPALAVPATFLVEQQSQSAPLVCDVVQHLGLNRGNQEDAALVVHRRVLAMGNLLDFHLAIVADGCGGMSSGEVASEITASEISTHVTARLSRYAAERGDQLQPEAVFSAMRAGFTAANKAIIERSEEDPALVGMASTAVAAVVHGHNAYVAWAGDSRLTVWRDGLPVFATADHNRAQLLVDEGIITAEEAATHPGKSHLTNALGIHTDNDPIPDVALCTVEPGDLLILSSDGFHEGLSAEVMSDTCGPHLVPPVSHDALLALGRDLVSESLSGYGDDNLTAVLMYVGRIKVI